MEATSVTISADRDQPNVTEEAAPGRTREHAWLLVLLPVIAVVAFFGWRGVTDAGPTEAEVAAKQRLTDLGAIVSMDGERRHVASVNLRLIKSGDDLAEAVSLLTDLPKIGALNLSDTAITDGQLETVGRLSSLKSLTLSQTGVGDNGVQSLAPLSRLESLQLVGTAVTPSSLEVLGRLKSLSSLDLSRTSIDSGLSPLTNLPRLECLVLRDATLGPGALSELSGCAKLVTLAMQGSTFDEEDLAALLEGSDGLRVER